MPDLRESLPKHGATSVATSLFETAALAAAAGLLACLALQFGAALDARWWLAPVLLLSALAADFASGLVHWFADTWGSERMPLLGPRLLRPFRVHHLNPDDLVERNFIDTNGDVAFGALPFLAAALLVPLEEEFLQALAVFLGGFGACALPTNQIHKWAHQPDPPAPVRWLQRCGLILGRAEHDVHHLAPHATHYCITNGWCNRPLAAVGFFPALEWLVTKLTGAQPRREDRALAVSPESALPARGGPAVS